MIYTRRSAGEAQERLGTCYQGEIDARGEVDAGDTLPADTLEGLAEMSFGRLAGRCAAAGM